MKIIHFSAIAVFAQAASINSKQAVAPKWRFIHRVMSKRMRRLLRGGLRHQTYSSPYELFY